MGRTAAIDAGALTRSALGIQDEISSGRVMSRALAASWKDGAHLSLARAFGIRMVSAWWNAIAGGDAIRSIWAPFDTADLQPAVEALADSLGETVAKLVDVEAAAYEIGLIYTGMLPIDHRSLHGIYYTPPALTARLIHLASQAGVDWSTARCLDPTSGGGAFLTPIAQTIAKALAHCDPRIIVENVGNRIRGYELDPFGGWLAQVTLDAAMLPITRAAGARLPVVVTVCDSLRRNPPRDRFDLVIGNPPYGRVKLSPADRARFKRSLYGHSNLYGLFTDMALRHTKVGGVIAFVTPTSFLAGEYYKNLRALLAKEAPPHAMDFVSVRKGVFDEVLQETLLATYCRGGKPGKIAVTELHPVDTNAVTVKAAGTVPLPGSSFEPWLLPRSAAQAPLVRRMGKMEARLADWGYQVSTGPLVWNRHKDQLVEEPGKGRHPLIWAESITADGRFDFRADRRGHVPYFQYRPGDGWLITDTACVLLQRTTAKEQQRRLIGAAIPEAFIRKHGSVVVENHINMVRPIDGEPAVDAKVLAAFLNSSAADRAFRCVSGSVAVSAFELESLPLPTVAALAPLTKLVNAGADKVDIERTCDQLYGPKR